MGAIKVFSKNRGVQLYPLHPSNVGPVTTSEGGGETRLNMLFSLQDDEKAYKTNLD